MYKLVSEYGNEVVYTDDEIKKELLLDRGFVVDNVSKAPEIKVKNNGGSKKCKKKK